MSQVNCWLNCWLPGVLVHSADGHVKESSASAWCAQGLLNWTGFLSTAASYQSGCLRVVGGLNVQALMLAMGADVFQKDTYGLRHECLSQNVGVTIM